MIAAVVPGFTDHPRGRGLFGPNARLWGAFNPAFFILPDGKRLA